MISKLLPRYAIRETMGIVVVGAALFWSAGTFDWWQAWAILAVTFIWIVATAYVILRFHPDLLAERLGPRKGAKSWDSAIMGVLGSAQLARYILAGLDQRHAWSGAFPLSIQLIALGVCVLGYCLFVWAIASNAFFSQIVRIQNERGQTVVRGGPYRYIRHPAYLGAILYEVAAPILLTSWWALSVSVLTVFLLILRTGLEDHALQVELAGYVDFTHQVRYRLFWGIW